MYARQAIPDALSLLAREQDGVITREQAVGHGLSATGVTRLVRDGLWLRVARGVYLTAPIQPSWPALAWAGVLIGGDHARLGGLAAAHLHGLLADPPPEIQVLIPNVQAVPKVAGPWCFLRERPGARRSQSIGSPSRLSVEDTVLDLVCDPDCDARAAAHWLTLAVQSRRTTPKSLLRAAEDRHFLPARAVVLKILADTAAGARSPLELDYLNLVERAHGLPEGTRQKSRRGTEVDVLYREYALIVELDGRLGHEGIGRFRDMRRDNASTTDGLATLRYGKADVFGSPCEVAVEVARNLALRGWEGPGHSCALCHPVAWGM